MISSVDDYRFVIGEDVDAAHPHGDLDRVIIDGDIMPLRTGNTERIDADGNPIPRKNILRGEDVAFIREAATERLALAELKKSESGIERKQFSMKIGSSQILDSVSDLREAVRVGRFYSGDIDFWGGDDIIQYGSPGVIYPFNGSEMTGDHKDFLPAWKRSVSVSPSNFGYSFSRSKIEDIFKDLKEMKYNLVRLESWPRISGGEETMSSSGDTSHADDPFLLDGELYCYYARDYNNSSSWKTEGYSMEKRRTASLSVLTRFNGIPIFSDNVSAVAALDVSSYMHDNLREATESFKSGRIYVGLGKCSVATDIAYIDIGRYLYDTISPILNKFSLTKYDYVRPNDHNESKIFSNTISLSAVYYVFRIRDRTLW